MPKLSPEVAAWIRGDGPLDITHSPQWEKYGPATRAALLLAQGGVRVFPCEEVTRCRAGTCAEARRQGPGGECPSPGKHPRIKRGVTRATYNHGQLREWADQWPNSNWGQALDTRVVVDIDVAEGKRGLDTWHEILQRRHPEWDPAATPPAELDTLAYRTGRGGIQLVFERPAGVSERDVPILLGEHIDLKRGRGSYVMVPGSVTDAPYAVTADLPVKILPPWILDEAKKYQAKKKAEKTKAAKAAGSPSGKGLSAELALSSGDSGKGNVWMTRVAGFLAAGIRREEDMVALLRIVNRTELDDPMSEEQVLKIARSVIEAEQRNHHGTKDGDVPIETDALHDPDVAYLAMTPDGQSIQVLASSGDPDMPPAVVRYLNCGIKPRWVVDAGESRYYHVEVRGPHHKGVKAVTVNAATLADPRKQAAWLAGLGGYVATPPSRPELEYNGPRLLTYIEGQKPASGRVVEFLGWHGADFLTPTGMLRDGEWVDFDGRIPRPEAVEQSTASYGHEIGREEVLDVLRSVWSFQEPQVASVAMAWWVMCLLKGTYNSSIAPILYVDAPSGSGKTNGFFAFLVALSGNRSGSGSITVPRVRHQLASNQSGIVWVDDMSDLRNLSEVLRQAASRGTHTKTDTTDNMRTISQHMVGNVLLSCEGLGRTLDEKAMRDRVIQLRVKSVKGRRSTIDATRPQWDDIIELLERYGTPADGYVPFAQRMAGTVIELLAEHRPVDLSAHKRGSDGRHAEKHAILRAGAEILAELLGFEDPIRHVEEWIGGDADRGGENLVVSYLAGRVWRHIGSPESQVVDRFGQKRPAAVFVDENGIVYISPEHFADEVAGIRDLDARDRQLASRDAVVSELQECGLTSRECRAGRRVGGRTVYYWRLTPLLSRIARGEQRAYSTLLD